MSDRLSDLEPYSPEWCKARDRFSREDPDGFRRWLDEEWARDRRRLHSERFRRVSNLYPHRVAEAYEGDLERAAADPNEQVAAEVFVWELFNDAVPAASAQAIKEWITLGAARGREREEVDGLDRVVADQDEWVRVNCGDDAAASANYGWGTDEPEPGTLVVSTKVYGHGVLVTRARQQGPDVVDVTHDFRPFGDEAA